MKDKGSMQDTALKGKAEDKNTPEAQTRNTWAMMPDIMRLAYLCLPRVLGTAYFKLLGSAGAAPIRTKLVSQKRTTAVSP